MNPIREQIELMTRRHFFGRTGLSLGTAALSTLAGARTRTAQAAHGARLERPRPAACPGCPISRPRPSGRSICT